MKHAIAALSLLLVTSGVAFAEDKPGDAAKAAAPAAKEAVKKPMTKQEKYKACSKEASAQKLKGADRKTFMSSCTKKS